MGEWRVFFAKGMMCECCSETVLNLLQLVQINSRDVPMNYSS